jgi:hypothetical protein
MREQALLTPASSNDPIDGAADVMESTVPAVEEETPPTHPAAGHFLSRMIYNSSYAISFGIVFPVMLVVRVVPKDNALVHGMVDGALAAREVVDRRGAQRPIEDLPEVPAHESHAIENGSSPDTKSTEQDNHTRRGTRRRGNRPSTSKRASQKT